MLTPAIRATDITPVAGLPAAWDSILVSAGKNKQHHDTLPIFWGPAS